MREFIVDSNHFFDRLINKTLMQSLPFYSNTNQMKNIGALENRSTPHYTLLLRCTETNCSIHTKLHLNLFNATMVDVSYIMYTIRRKRKTKTGLHITMPETFLFFIWRRNVI